MVHGWLSSKYSGFRGVFTLSGLSGEKWPVVVQSIKEDVASMFVAMEGGELRILHKIPSGLLMRILVERKFELQVQASVSRCQPLLLIHICTGYLC